MKHILPIHALRKQKNEYILLDTWTRTAKFYSCNDNIDGIDILSSPTCKSVDVMDIFNSTPRRNGNHGVVNGIKTFVDKRESKKGTFVYFTFLNVNRFEKSVTNNIQNEWCKLVSFEFGFVTWFTKHELYKVQCNFERGSGNSVERMWCIPNSFCINDRSFSETSWNIGYV
jgi:hypothetical protein